MIARIIRSLANAEATAPPWSLRTALSTLVIAVVAMIAGTFLAFSITSDIITAPLLAWTLGGLVTVVYVWRSRREERADLRLNPANVRLYIVLLFGMGMAVLIDILILVVIRQYLPVPELATFFAANPGLFAWLLAFLFMLIVQPLAEELVFRAVLYPALSFVLGGWLGWLLSAAFYAFFHMLIYAAPSGNPWITYIQPLLAGLFFGAVRANTRSTAAAIAAHVGFGIFALLRILLLPV
jgi:membrane protease YdiL (CAAX protease family)